MVDGSIDEMMWATFCVEMHLYGMRSIGKCLLFYYQ